MDIKKAVYEVEIPPGTLVVYTQAHDGYWARPAGTAGIVEVDGVRTVLGLHEWDEDPRIGVGLLSPLEWVTRAVDDYALPQSCGDERKHHWRDVVWKVVLQLAADGHEDAAKMASKVLEIESIRFSRWYA